MISVAHRPAPSINRIASRRDVLLGSAATIAVAGQTLSDGKAFAQQPPNAPAMPADGEAFNRTALIDYARGVSKRPYAAPVASLPDWLTGLTYDSYIGIKNRPERAIWSSPPRGFVIEPLHRGFVFQAPVQISMIEGGNVRRLAYSANNYEFGKIVPPPNVGDIGFSGFRLLKTSVDTPPRELAVFQGATFLRAIARHQSFGAIARALSLKTADPRGEEFPFFRAFWIEEPQRDDVIVIHALLDSESVTGLLTYTVRAGDVTLIDTEASIFPRVVLDNVGLAGMQATHFFGWTDRRGIDDYRPAVYEVGGLQMRTGAGEWLWRPVNNPKQLQISAFMDENPKGFGFVMREREFSAFQDHDARFEGRPTLWIEPLADWGAGAIQLVEIPSDNEINDNIIAHWRPKEPMQPGTEYIFAYRQHWCWSPPERPPLATVSGTRVGRGMTARRRRFVVDFVGERLASIGPEEISAEFWASNNGMQGVTFIPGGSGRPHRVAFTLDTGSETLIEMRLQLMSGKTPISETWLYRWT